MGCVMSNVTKTSPNRRPRPQLEPKDDDKRPPPPAPLEFVDQLRMDRTSILQGLSQIHCPEWTTPVVCLSERSYPLFLNTFKFEDRRESIELPVIAFSRVENGRFIFIGNIEFVSHPILQHTETSAFIENMITWGADYKIQTIKITLLGIPQPLVSTLQTDFSSYGYVVDAPKDPPLSLNSAIVFIASNYVCGHLNEMIIDYVKRGGTVICFAVQPEEGGSNGLEFPINRQLAEAGLAFTSCSLKSTNKIISSSVPAVLDKYTYKNIIDRYVGLLNEYENEEDVDINALDDVISQLRFYIEAFTDLNYEEAHLLETESFKFLQKIGIKNEDGICPSVVHGLVTVVITEIVPKLAPSDITQNPLLEEFPGVTGKNVTLSKVKLRIGMKSDSWNSTGLWIPAGTVGTITTDSPIILQVGSHNLCLLVKPGPWKRWPIVTTRFVVEPNTLTEFASPFGGIIYFLTERNRTIHAMLNNISRYPYYVFQKPSIWEATQNLNIPWGEIQLKTIIFTMPTEYIKQIENLEEFCKLYEKLISDTFSFCGLKPSDLRRIVFDVDLLQNTPVSTDILVLHTDSMEGIINIHQANSDILQLLTYLVLASINGIFHDYEIELTIATIAGCYAIKKSWPDEPPLIALSVSPSKLFCELFDLSVEKGHTPYAMAIQTLSSAQNIKTAREAWQFFVEKLSRFCNKDLPHLTDRFRQTGQLAAESPEKLNAYLLENIEE